MGKVCLNTHILFILLPLVVAYIVSSACHRPLVFIKNTHLMPIHCPPCAAHFPLGSARNKRPTDLQGAGCRVQGAGAGQSNPRNLTTASSGGDRTITITRTTEPFSINVRDKQNLLLLTNPLGIFNLPPHRHPPNSHHYSIGFVST